jgi:5'-nucleotidase
MAAYLKAESAEVDGRAIIVHAGDMVGASPPVSALMQDEPSMQLLKSIRRINAIYPQTKVYE